MFHYMNLPQNIMTEPEKDDDEDDDDDDDMTVPAKVSDSEYDVNPNFVLDQLQLQNYDDVKKTLEQETITPSKSRSYLKRVI